MNNAKDENPEMQANEAIVLTLSPELWEYLNSPLPTAEIAAAHGISAATLTVRAKRKGLPLRKCGRRPMTESTSLQRKILAFAEIHGCQKAGLKFDLTRQWVNRLQHRWEGWKATSQDRETKNAARLKANQYTVRFRLERDSFHQLRRLLQHPWF